MYNEHAPPLEPATWHVFSTLVSPVSDVKQAVVTYPIAFSFGSGLYFNRGLPLLLRFPLLNQFKCFAALLGPFLGRSFADLKLDAFLYRMIVEGHFDRKKVPGQ